MLLIEQKIQTLSKHKAVLVSGAQRSGTTICARIIADRLGYDYVDENDIGMHNLDQALRYMSNSRVVIQCPHMAQLLHTIRGYDDFCIVWMLRKVNDIIHSQQRINWGTNADGVRNIYRKAFPLYYEDQVPICYIKNMVWFAVQKPLITNSMEIIYDDLSVLPEFVPKPQRSKFGARQWKIGQA